MPLTGVLRAVDDALASGELRRASLPSLVEKIDHEEHVRYEVAELSAALDELCRRGRAVATPDGWRRA